MIGEARVSASSAESSREETGLFAGAWEAISFVGESSKRTITRFAYEASRSTFVPFCLPQFILVGVIDLAAVQQMPVLADFMTVLC